MFVDPAMMEYFESTAPDPSQDSLDVALQQAVRMRVYQGGVAGGKLLSDSPPVLDTHDPGDLAKVREALRIEGEPGGHCMCHGDQGVEFLDAAGKVVALLGLHHGHSIRWDAWKDDAVLSNGRLLLSWLSERGVPGPLARYEEALSQQKEHEHAFERWEAATPECLRSLKAEREGIDYPAAYEHEHEKFAVLETALAAAYPDEDQRVRALYEWFGSGQGPWSGYPSYEGEAESFLMRHQTPTLIRAFESTPDPTPQFLEGAARLFGGWTFHSKRKKDRRLLSDELKRRLREHVLPTDDEDKAGRATSAFGF